MTNTHHSDGAISVKINEVEIIHQTIQGPQGPKGEDGAIGPVGPQGPKGEDGATGPRGEDGKSATITIGKVTQGDTPSVTNSGTETDVVLDFVLPGADKPVTLYQSDFEQMPIYPTLPVSIQMGKYMITAEEVKQTPLAWQQSHIRHTDTGDWQRIKILDVGDVISAEENANGWAIHSLDQSHFRSDVDGVYFSTDWDYPLSITANVPPEVRQPITITHPRITGTLTVEIVAE